MPGLPPPLLPEADRGYKRAGRAPAAAPLCACAHAAARGAQRGAQGGGGEGEEEEVEEGGRQRGARCGQPQCVDYPLLHYAGATVQLKGDCTRPAGLDCSAAVPYEEGTSECGRGAAGGCRGRCLPAGRGPRAASRPRRAPQERAGPRRLLACTLGWREVAAVGCPAAGPPGEGRRGWEPPPPRSGLEAGGGRNFQKENKTKFTARSCSRRPQPMEKFQQAGRIGCLAVRNLGKHLEKKLP